MANNKLQMPTGYEVLNENEKSCVEEAELFRRFSSRSVVCSLVSIGIMRTVRSRNWRSLTALLCPKEMVFTPSRMELPMRPLRRIPMALPVWAISSMVSATFLVSLADICDFGILRDNADS